MPARNTTLTKTKNYYDNIHQQKIYRVGIERVKSDSGIAIICQEYITLVSFKQFYKCPIGE